MDSGIEIAGAQVTQHAGLMRRHGEQYSAALRRLQERGYGCQSWGDDTGLFSGLYEEYARCGLFGVEALRSISTFLAETGDGLDTARANIADAEAGPYGPQPPAHAYPV
ncbi:hypothetical protein FAF44_47415 [Nonomuraea sp. MG754425]|uniref:hypothetical protein n=1 Tax=Nonomuraea sp. MG754425 TaxID=2570319 RepID=UPI001F22C43D|nr:hypothetical protein [Nonomuraea sp. MG754425]MCF6475919.1 hypothetical protein [Nonomuraea sp. MG754425]